MLEIAQTFPDYLFPTLDFHPWPIEATLDTIERGGERCLALGEVGLDFKAENEKVLQIRLLQCFTVCWLNSLLLTRKNF
ncbi:MAG: TatD family hydrolase [Syntrophobacterales bacterium]|nr:MAG: TatD family hydrolase [Syntrophobacterales bacterium]